MSDSRFAQVVRLFEFLTFALIGVALVLAGHRDLGLAGLFAAAALAGISPRQLLPTATVAQTVAEEARKVGAVIVAAGLVAGALAGCGPGWKENVRKDTAECAGRADVEEVVARQLILDAQELALRGEGPDGRAWESRIEELGLKFGACLVARAAVRAWEWVVAQLSAALGPKPTLALTGEFVLVAGPSQQAKLPTPRTKLDRSWFERAARYRDRRTAMQADGLFKSPADGGAK